MSICRTQLRNTSNALMLWMSSEQMCFQIWPKLFRVNSWIPLMISFWSSARLLVRRQKMHGFQRCCSHVMRIAMHLLNPVCSVVTWCMQLFIFSVFNLLAVLASHRLSPLRNHQLASLKITNHSSMCVTLSVETTASFTSTANCKSASFTTYHIH